MIRDDADRFYHKLATEPRFLAALLAAPNEDERVMIVRRAGYSFDTAQFQRATERFLASAEKTAETASRLKDARDSNFDPATLDKIGNLAMTMLGIVRERISLVYDPPAFFGERLD